MSKTQTLMAEIRKTPAYRQLVPMEAAIGWPATVRKHLPSGLCKVYAAFLIFGQSPDPAGGVSLHAPLALMTVAWEDGKLVEYVDLRYRYSGKEPGEGHYPTDLSEPVGKFPHEAIRTMTRGDYQASREELLCSYDTLFETLEQNGTLSKEWQAAFSQFLAKMVEPSLLPFYRVEFPKFWDAFVPATPAC